MQNFLDWDREIEKKKFLEDLYYRAKGKYQDVREKRDHSMV